MHKILLGLAVLAFCVLAVHAHFPQSLSLNEDLEMALIVAVAILVPLGLLLWKDDPLPYLISKMWFAVCGFTVLTVLDWGLGLGRIQYGLVTVFPLHLFTAYGAWMIATTEPIEQEHVRRLWVAFGVALVLSPLFNYG